jgi:hypothetical protein
MIYPAMESTLGASFERLVPDHGGILDPPKELLEVWSLQCCIQYLQQLNIIC